MCNNHLFLFAMITVPKQLYVAFKDQGKDEVPLGFAVPQGTDAAAQKRRETADQWARGRYWQNEAPAKPSETIDNTPVEGFQICKAIKRTGWNGGNVVWRLEDPRGFELEIQSGNFAAIVAHCDIDKGVIKGKCVWARDGARNVLLPEGSEPYELAFKTTERVNKKVEKGGYKPGDTIELKDGRIVSYMGEFKILVIAEDDSATIGWGRTGHTKWKFDVIKRHVLLTQWSHKIKGTYNYPGLLRQEGTAIYEFAANLHVSSVVEAVEADSVDMKTMCENVMAFCKKYDVIGRIVAVHPASVKLAKPTAQLIETTYTDIVNDDLSTKRKFAFRRGHGQFDPLYYQRDRSSAHVVVGDPSNGEWQTHYSGKDTIHMSQRDTQRWYKLVANWNGVVYDTYEV